MAWHFDLTDRVWDGHCSEDPKGMGDDLIQGFEMRVGDVMAKARFQSISTTESLLANPNLPA